MMCSYLSWILLFYKLVSTWKTSSFSRSGTCENCKEKRFVDLDKNMLIEICHFIPLKTVLTYNK